MDEKEFLTVEEFSLRSGYSVITVRRYVSKKRISSVQPGGVGHRILIPVTALTELVRKPDKQSSPRAISAEVKAKPLPGPSPRWKNGSHK